MKLLTRLLFFLALFCAPVVANAIVFNYVNTDLPGIHKDTNPYTGEECWYDDMGNNLCPVENSLPMKEIDKFFGFMGDKESNWVKKVWDPKRGCYVWESIDGDFLGTDLESLSEKDLDWLAEVDPTWFDDNQLPDELNEKLWEKRIEQQIKHAEKELEKIEKEKAMKEAKDEAKAKKDAEEASKAAKEEEKKAKEKADADKKMKEAEEYMAMSDEELRAAEAEIAKARAELHALGMTDYDGYLNQAQEAINQAKAARARYNKERNAHR